MLDQSYLKSLIDYNPETGILTWKERNPETFKSGAYSSARICNMWNSLHAGKAATAKRQNGYITICVDYKGYLAHRLAWYWMTGELPEYIDHINMNKSDNRWCNLRISNKSTNGMNRGAPANNTSGAKGIYSQAGKWRVRIRVGNKFQHFGYFDDFEDARIARDRAIAEHHGEFARAS